MRDPLFEGCGTALVTPMRGGRIDFDALNRLVDAQIEAGVRALVACGTTGEPSTMTEQEQDDVIASVVRRARGRAKVVAGVGGNWTEHVIKRAARAQQLGADAVLCVTPYYNKTTQAGLIAHYRAIAEGPGLPVIVYNVPSRTALNLEPETLEALLPLERIAGLKEASADKIHIARVMELCRDRLAVYSGADENTAYFMEMGAQGLISVASNFRPLDMIALVAAHGEQAARMQMRLDPLLALLFSETNPIPCKAAMEMLGLCDGELRLPLVPMSANGRALLREAMNRLGTDGESIRA